MPRLVTALHLLGGGLFGLSFFMNGHHRYMTLLLVIACFMPFPEVSRTRLALYVLGLGLIALPYFEVGLMDSALSPLAAILLLPLLQAKLYHLHRHRLQR